MMTVRLTREFRKRLPNATLSISEGLSISMQEWLLTGRLDIALLYNPVPSAGVETIPLAEEELYLVTRRSGNAKSSPVSLKDIATLPLVIPNRPNAFRMLIEAQMASIGCKPLIGLEIDGVPAILDLVADGAGHAILSKYAVSTAAKPDAYLINRIVEPRLVSKLSLATAAGRITTLTQKAMLELIQEVAREVFGNALPR
jgi:LysR family nitrogen assimilation transcriptional regulator